MPSWPTSATGSWTRSEARWRRVWWAVRMTPEDACTRGGDRPGRGFDAEHLGSRQEAGWIVDHAGVDLAPELASTADGRRAPPVRARPLAVPIARAGCGPAGADPPTRDRTGRRGGAGRTGAGAASVDAQAPTRSASTWGPAREPSPSRWPSKGAPATRIWRSGPPTSRRTRWRWPGPTWPAWPGPIGRRPAGFVRRGPLVRGPPVPLAGRVDLLVANPPYVAEGEYAGADPRVRLWEPTRPWWRRSDDVGVPGMAAIAAIISAPAVAGTPGLVVEIAPSLAGPGLAAARRAASARCPRSGTGRAAPALVARW